MRLRAFYAVGLRWIATQIELTAAAFKRLKPMRGRPPGSGKKVQLTVRFDAEIVEAFKSAGDGWQTRMNGALREWLEKH